MGAGAGPTLLRGREPGGQTDLVARFAQGPSRGPENDRGRPVRRRHDPSLSLSMNRAVVGQASRLPSGRLAPGFVAGETPAKTAGTAAPLLPRARSWSQCAHTMAWGLSMNRVTVGQASCLSCSAGFQPALTAPRSCHAEHLPGILPAEALDKCSADGTSAAPSRLVEA